MRGTAGCARRMVTEGFQAPGKQNGARAHRGAIRAAASSAPYIHCLHRLVRAVESREWTTPAPSSAELPGRRIARRTYEGHLPSSVRSGPTSRRDRNLIRLAVEASILSPYLTVNPKKCSRLYIAETRGDKRARMNGSVTHLHQAASEILPGQNKDAAEMNELERVECMTLTAYHQAPEVC